MLFSSQAFLLLFLPLAVAGYYLLARREGARLWFLVGASLVFYGWWDPRFVPLLAGSVTVNWLLARACGREGASWLAPAGVAFNLALLGLFKYADFLGGSFAWLSGTSHERWSIVLPLGISFFTFQQVSYLADLRRGAAPLYSFRDYALFVTFFPQLIAGPIVRHGEIVHQYRLDPLRQGRDERVARGLAFLALGLMEKTLLADPLGRVADPLYAAALAGEPLGLAGAWAAALAFGLQIFFDFAGYSDMAIGLALIFGFDLPQNFAAPYRAASIREFWRRWHMTLSRFLRDYLYIPLGGSRHGAARNAAALMVTMLLGGLWHGAAWTFAAWGGIHGAALAVHRLWGKTGLRLPAPAGWLLTMAVVFLAWVMFRAQGFAAAWDIWAAMAGLGPPAGGSAAPDWALIAAAAALALGLPTSHRLVFGWLRPSRALALACGGAIAYVVLLVGSGANQEFIYFQF